MSGKGVDLVEECYKISYATPQAAHKVIQRSKGRRGRKESTTYFCETCKAHHITSQKE